MQVRMVKQIMRKTAENEDIEKFKEELYIAEVCKSDDFYQNFGWDEEEVKAFVGF